MNMENKMIPVLITTAHKGVFAGLIPEDANLSHKSMPLKSARMAIRFGTNAGVLELAQKGPNEGSKIGAAADIPMLHDITMVARVTDAAWDAWLAA